MPTHLCTEQRICITLFSRIRDSIFQITIYIQKYNSKGKRKILQKLGIFWLCTKYCDLQRFKLCFHTTTMMMIETAFFCCHEFLRKKLFQLFNASVVFWHNWISTQNNMTKCILESLFNSSLLRFLGCSVVFHKVFAIKVFYSIKGFLKLSFYVYSILSK